MYSIKTISLPLILISSLITSCAIDELMPAQDCGNGKIELWEECDNGLDNSVIGECTPICRLAACGDGLVGPKEQCDFGKANGDDQACTNICKTATCGDGLVGPNEECDQGLNNTDGGSCNSSCQLAMCGDGLVGPGEQCDDGIANSDTGLCTTGCRLGICGDGLISPEEECDQGNDNGDSAACTLTCTQATCGDGLVGPQEECDQGPENADNSTCTTNCTRAYCGDGLVGPEEECDLGDANSDTIAHACNTRCLRTIPEMVVTPSVVPIIVCDSDTIPLIIANTGRGNLIVTHIEFSNISWSTSAVLPLAVEEGTQMLIDIVVTPGTSTISVASNTTTPETLALFSLTALADQAPVISITDPISEPTFDIGQDAAIVGSLSDDVDNAQALTVTWQDSNGVVLSTDAADSNGTAEMLWKAQDRASGSQDLEFIVTDSCGNTSTTTLTVCQQAGFETNQLDLENWHLEGNAQWDSDDNILQLTDNSHFRVGTAFENTTPVNAADVAIEFNFFIGDGSGADGLSLTALDINRMTSYQGGAGCGIGYGGNMSCTGGHRLPGWSIEVDTWYNGGGVDPTPLDHLMFTFDGSNESLWAVLPEMEDTGWHKMTVVVNAPNVYVAIDDVVYIDSPIEGNFDFDAYVGFTAATGGATNFHLIESLMVTSFVCENP